MRIGSNFDGTDKIKTSIANEEILPNDKSFYKFALMVKQDTKVSINDSSPIFIESGVGFSTDQIDSVIHSFKILDNGVPYYWMGGY